MAGDGANHNEPAENEVTKALRTYGFPDIQQKIIASQVTPKILTGLQKCEAKVSKTLSSLSEAQNPTSVMQSTLEFKTCFLRPVHLRSFMSLRHVNTLDTLVKRLQSDKDALNEKYSSGFIDGFTVELLDKTNCQAFGLRPGWKRSLLGWSRMPENVAW